jgi:hypothetical protein
VIRVVILADTHGVLDPRIASLAAACDWVVHAGDVGNAAVLAQLRPRGGRVVAVSGNNDVPAKWPGPDRGVLATLPEQALLELPGGLLAVDHGHRAGSPARRHATLRRRYPEARAVVYGHSHHLVLDREQEPWVLNPGAAGRARTFGGPSCLLLAIRGEVWELEARRFPL